MTRAKVLVVEDEIVVAKAIELALQRHGYDVPATVSSGLEAIQKAAEIQPDLVLMDIVLKGDMDGIVAAEQIRDRFNIPIVYLTAYTDSDTVQRAKITEPFGYITKPFEERELHTNIEMALYKHKMDKALRESESEKQLILSTLSELIAYQDKNLRVVWANKAAGDSVGQSAEKLVGRHCYEVWHGRREPCPNCPVLKTIETGQPAEGEITLSDGRIWDIRANPVLNEAGEVTGVVETTLDITERKRAEEKLRQNERKYREIIESSHEVIFSKNRDGHYHTLNLRAAIGLGCKSIEDVVGKTDYELLPEKQADALLKADKEVMAKGKHVEVEEVVRDIHGENKTYLSHKWPTYNKQGGIDGISCFAMDITERKRAEEKIESLAKFPAENPNPVLRISEDGTILYANYSSRHALETWGCKRGERLPQACGERVKEALSSGVGSTFEFGCDNGIVYLVTLEPVVDAGYVNVYGVDITERKKTELQLLDYQAQLRSLALERLRIEEAERRRLAGVVHDNIGQELALAKLELQSSMQSTMGPEALRILDKVCQLLDKAIEDVHSLTFELSSPVLYEVGLVAAVEQWLAEEIRQKHGIKYNFAADVKSKAFDHELSATVFRVVRELLINVVKHAKAKNVQVGIKELKGALSVAIEDDGVGFDVARFETALRKGKKTQFGLFSAKEQLDFLGGKFRIESVPKKGTKVSLTIPLKR